MRGPGLLLCLCALLERLSPARSLHHAVHWNSSNPRFLKEDYTVQVAINDYLDIYCPHYELQVPVEQTENFMLYIVDREGYEGCYTTPASHKRWPCNRPHAPAGPIYFSEKIHRFSPYSLGFEFHAGQDYYYISVPDEGSVGKCQRLRVTVCCRPTSRPVTEVPKSQPRGGEPGRRSPSQGDSRRQSGNSSAGPLTSSVLLLTLCLIFLWC
ncbi:ephrin-A4-like [Bufo bufo]|uniref:ephrin-A4-like n=1 Tax=Bufo bufo TaxID=8384 RepID=UPI001ABE8AC7|nr:ephrin-A4-like [Bufo bufo]XP_040268207.1 ephrin-A4-like [Bufo bufo]